MREDAQAQNISTNYNFRNLGTNFLNVSRCKHGNFRYGEVFAMARFSLRSEGY